MYFDTVAEYDEEISAFRAGLRALATASSYVVAKDGSSRELKREGISAYKSYLKELISERAALSGTSASGSAPAGRVYAKSGRGRG